MSILSNHFPEILDELHGGPPEPGCPPCCAPEVTGRLCPQCAQDYEAWSRQVEAQGPS
jgi:hypothetical protein